MKSFLDLGVSTYTLEIGNSDIAEAMREEEDAESLSRQELQKLVRDLSNKVSKLEYYTSFS